MKINEIFKSIQGEGKYTGHPVLFIRTSGCTRQCDFCDTQYHKNGKEMSVKQIVKIIEKSGMDIVVWTGGEPLLQKKEIYEIIKNTKEKQHHLESNGDLLTWREFDYFNYISISPKVLKIAQKCKKYMDEYIDANKPKINFDFSEFSSDWLIGFIEGDGCFTYCHCKSRGVAGLKENKIYPVFSISQNEKEILLKIKKCFGFGSVYPPSGKNGVWIFQTQSRKYCKRIAKFINEKLILEKRKKQFAKWIIDFNLLKKDEIDIKVVTDLKMNKDMIEYATILMPLSTYDEKKDKQIQKDVWEYCVKNKIKYASRIHISVWGKSIGK